MFKEGIDKVNMLLRCNMGLLVIRNNESGEKKNKAGITLQSMLQELWATISNI